jgi:hypothetical protein
MFKNKIRILGFFVILIKKDVIWSQNLKTINQSMKKVLTLMAVVGMSAAFVSCGPSKEEMERRDQAKRDSIAAVEKAKQDSIAEAAADADRLEQEANMQRMADSTRVADSLANASKGKKR